MSRQDLIDKLATYGACHPGERTTIEQFLTFGLEDKQESPTLFSIGIEHRCLRKEGSEDKRRDEHRKEDGHHDYAPGERAARRNEVAGLLAVVHVNAGLSRP